MTGFDTIEQASRTDIGLRRSHNQDAFAIDIAAPEGERFREHGHLFLVADGMGGHAVGEKASAKAVRDIPHTYHKHVADGPDKALKRAFVETNAGIFAIGQENPEFRGLGTTAMHCCFRRRRAGSPTSATAVFIAFAPGRSINSHSTTARFGRSQAAQIGPGELQGIRSNVILRSLGPDSLVEVDIEGPHPIQPGDVFLLCSDGLSGQLTDYEIGAVAASLPPEEACDFLVELANLRGGPDNITVLIAKVGSAEAARAGHRCEPAQTAVCGRSLAVDRALCGIAFAILAVVLKAAELRASCQRSSSRPP